MVSDQTILKDGIRTSYWLYAQDGGNVRAVKIEFRLNGKSLEVRNVSSRYQSSNELTKSQRTSIYISGSGWTNQTYATDLIRVKGIEKNKALDVSGNIRLRRDQVIILQVLL